jgi:hypothetical protein
LLTFFKGIQGSTGNDKQKKEKKHNAIEVMTCQIIHGKFSRGLSFFVQEKKEFLLAH